MLRSPITAAHSPHIVQAERKVLAEKSAAAEAIKDRAGLAIELLDETPEDAQRAKLIEFGPEHTLDHCLTKSLFHTDPPVRDRAAGLKDGKGKLKSRLATEKTKEELQKNLVRNTRAAIDPFLAQHESRPRPVLGIKIQKRKAMDDIENPEPGPGTTKMQAEKPRVECNLDLDYSSE